MYYRNTTCPPSYLHNVFLETGALGHNNIPLGVHGCVQEPLLP